MGLKGYGWLVCTAFSYLSHHSVGPYVEVVLLCRTAESNPIYKPVSVTHSNLILDTQIWSGLVPKTL